MKTLTAEITIKTHYLTMFVNRGYIDNVISQVPSKDTRRITLIVTIHENYINAINQYATSVTIIVDKTKLEEDIKQLRADLNAARAELNKTRIDLNKTKANIIKLEAQILYL